MPSESYETYSRMVGSRGIKPEVEVACGVLDDMKCSDLLTLLTVISDIRSKDVSINNVIQGNRFHSPSTVSQHTFHKVEGLIFDTLPDTEFVELSPLQPFGINKVLAGINEKNVVASLRRSEVLADATTALFRLAIDKLDGSSQQKVTIASNVRTTRSQVFDKDSKFLPHFKVFAQTTVGRQENQYDILELETLSDHLAAEVSIIDRVSNISRSRIKKTQIAVGNLILIQDLVERGLVNIEEIRKNTSNPEYDAIRQANIGIPSQIPFNSTDIGNDLESMGFKRGRNVTATFQKIVAERHPDLIPRLVLDIGRIAGVNYYKHMSYKIYAENNNNEILPIADGGTTDWAEKTNKDKRLYTVTTGIGTELLCSYLLE